MTREDIWIVVPTLNEEGNIARLLHSIRSELEGVSYRLCVVDDGSADGTLNEIRGFERETQASNIHVLNRKKKGLGSQRGVAVWTGLKYGLANSSAHIFIEMDADLSHRPEELRAGIAAIGESGYQAVIASKYLAGSQVVNRPASRRMLSFILNRVVRFLIDPNVRDYSNGYRFYDRECAAIICTHQLRYGSPIYLSETLALLLAHQMRVQELPTTYVGRGEGLSKLRPVDLLKASIAVFDIATRYHFHKRGFVRGTPSFSQDISESEARPEFLPK